MGFIPLSPLCTHIFQHFHHYLPKSDHHNVNIYKYMHIKSNESEMKYWIGVSSKDHVDAGKRLGIAQFCHGKFSAAKRLHRGDFLLYYSPSLFMKGDSKAVDNK